MGSFMAKPVLMGWLGRQPADLQAEATKAGLLSAPLSSEVNTVEAWVAECVADSHKVCTTMRSLIRTRLQQGKAKSVSIESCLFSESSIGSDSSLARLRSVIFRVNGHGRDLGLDASD